VQPLAGAVVCRYMLASVSLERIATLKGFPGARAHMFSLERLSG
jgi:hypothetical protein